MTRRLIFYLCPKCFKLREGDVEGHEHGKMIRFDASTLTPEQRKPLFDQQGRLVTRAPRWFLQAVAARRRT